MGGEKQTDRETKERGDHTVLTVRRVFVPLQGLVKIDWSAGETTTKNFGNSVLGEPMVLSVGGELELNVVVVDRRPVAATVAVGVGVGVGGACDGS
jgi:hypothetical protein